MSVRSGRGRRKTATIDLDMGRMRKATRLWSDPRSRIAAASVIVGQQSESAVFSARLSEWFGRCAPLEVEIGAGKGAFIVERARSLPERNFLAVELPTPVVRVLAVRAGRSGLANLRVLQADARSLVGLLLPDNTVSAYHVYYPDPWPKARHAKHRLFSPHFVASLFRTLVDCGMVYVASDVKAWADYIFGALEEGGFVAESAPVPGVAAAGFGSKYAAQGRPLFARAFRKPLTQHLLTPAHD
jgi:tRNA (guanine-N(7)-)-methyltransferase